RDAYADGKRPMLIGDRTFRRQGLRTPSNGKVTPSFNRAMLCVNAATIHCLCAHIRCRAGVLRGTLLRTRPHFLNQGWMRQHQPNAIQPGPSAKVSSIADELRVHRRRQAEAFRSPPWVWNADCAVQGARFIRQLGPISPSERTILTAVS